MNWQTRFLFDFLAMGVISMYTNTHKSVYGDMKQICARLCGGHLYKQIKIEKNQSNSVSYVQKSYVIFMAHREKERTRNEKKQEREMGACAVCVCVCVQRRKKEMIQANTTNAIWHLFEAK